MQAFVLRPLTADYLPQLLAIQEETLAGLPSADLLRRNTPQMLESCLRPPHLTVGAFDGDTLAGFSVLYDPIDPGEDLAGLLTTVSAAGVRAANYKLCIVRPAYRGNGLQYRLGRELDAAAVTAGVKLLCVTVSPQNVYSMRNIEKLGYRYDHTLKKYGFERQLWYKLL